MSKKEIATNPTTSVIIVAGGKSNRMGLGVNKIFLEILGKPILAYTLEAFECSKNINEIIIVTRENDIFMVNDIIKTFNISKVKTIVSGGCERQISVRNGLAEVSDNIEYIAIHDAARPLISVESIDSATENCYSCKAVTLGVPIKDTIKICDENGFTLDTPSRDKLWAIQTPQIFERGIIINAHENANDGFTDDATMVESLGIPVKVIMGSYENIKVTTAEDLAVIEMLLTQK